MERSVHVSRGFSRASADFQNWQTPYHTRNICTVSLHCEFFGEWPGSLPLWIVCYRQYICTVSLPNDFDCVLPNGVYLYNTCHIQCTGNCCCDCSCVNARNARRENLSHRNTSYLQPATVCELINCLLLKTVYHALGNNTVRRLQWHQVRALPQSNYLHVHSMINIHRRRSRGGGQADRSPLIPPLSAVI